jgi:heme exporter protein C
MSNIGSAAARRRKGSVWHTFANPSRFRRLADRLIPWTAAGAILLLSIGLFTGLFVAPPDYQQGDTVRIMFVHVPSAWMALFVYSVIAAASGSYLVWCHPLADLAARASAPIGAAFTFLALFTGSLWGRPMWGAWWVWDARLTSVLVLFFLYLGYMALANAFDDRERGRKSAAVLALVGFVNVPIVKFSVDWWNTLHQPASVLRADGPAIHQAILIPLLVMSVGFTLFYVTLMLIRVKTGLIEARVHKLRVNAARAGSGG